MDKKGFCYWITGLSCSGKTTLSILLKDHLTNNLSTPTLLLDGDKMREVLDSKTNNLSDRLKRSYQYSRLCKLITDQNINVVIAVIGLFHEVHAWNKSNIQNYVEIFLDTPIEELKRRDTKGLYSSHKMSQSKNIMGIDLKVEFPKKPNILIEWKKNISPEKTLDEILKKI
jgi:adenylylsulfate kinase